MTFRNIPVPKLRSDLIINLIEEHGEQFVAMQCNFGIAGEPIAVGYNFFILLQQFDGKRTLNEVGDDIEKELGAKVDIDLIDKQLIDLANLKYLETEDYLNDKKEKNLAYLRKENRPAVCAGASYSSERIILEAELDNIFNSVEKTSIQPGAKCIIVPHIDFRIGNIAHETYASGYHSLRDTDADLFVIFGTAHYAFSDYFMLSRKNFETPLGTAVNDKEIIDKLSIELPGSFVVDEFAHKPEHSIEFQIVLLQHYFKGRNFKILPILVGSFYQFITQNNMPESNEKISKFTQNLDRIIRENGRKPAYISSVDFSHIGRKFDDNYDAEPLLPQIRNEDFHLIKSIENLDKDSFFNKISMDGDKYKVCGTSPIYSMLSATNFKESTFLKYNQWNEVETKSAVTFASFALY
jgi:AmmeMemoRadiSam system protein B